MKGFDCAHLAALDQACSLGLPELFFNCFSLRCGQSAITQRSVFSVFAPG
jgi:hypothetical protein